MKKKISKFLSVVLAVIMVLSIIPMSSITASAETTSGSCGENLTWSFDEETGILTITGSGDMYDYYQNTVPWLSIRNSIEEVVLNGDITSIGNNAFSISENLSTVTIPDSVTKIGDSAFYYCEKLESIIIPDSVTEIGKYVFANCKSASSLTIGKGLTEISSHAFSDCPRLKNVVIPDNIEIIGDGAFWFCIGLESIIIPNGVTKIKDSAFEHCRLLKSLSIPASVTSIGNYIVSYCTSLKGIIVDVKNEHYCSDEFGVLYNITKTHLMQYPAGNENPNYIIPETVRNIGYGAFANTDFSVMSIPESVEKIGWMAFDSCHYLHTLYLSSSVTEILYGAFLNCASLKNVYYTDNEYEWNNIVIGDRNYELLDADIHFEYYCLEHSFGEWKTIPHITCGYRERERRYCLYCDEFETRYTGNIVEHEFTDWIVAREPNCTTHGEEYRYCETCGEEEHRFTAALGHTPAKAVEENYVAPTFTETGSKDIVVYCSACNEVISRETIVVSFTGFKDDHFYKDGVRLSAYQLVELDGDFYYIGDRHKIIKNKKVYIKAERLNGLTYEDGTPIQAGYYDFDENGKMVILNGPVGDYFYKNNERLNAYQLVEVDGDFYYIGDRHQIVKNKTVYVKEERINGLTYEDGTPIKAGTYSFDENGKMVILNGVVDDSIYKNNIQLKAYQLVEVDGDFYYIGDRHKIVKNKEVYVKAERLNGLTYEDGTPLEAGWYSFDENGKLIKE